MSSVKDKIIEKVNRIQDSELLDELLQAVDLEYEIEQALKLTDEEKMAIDKGIKDADTGKLYSNSEASQLVKKWASQ